MRTYNRTRLFVISLFLFIFATTTPAASAKTYRIGVLVDILGEDVLPLLDHLKSEIEAVVGNTATLEFDENEILHNHFDLEVAKKNYQTLINNNTDIILAFGPINNSVIQQQKIHRKPTILFGAVNIDQIPIDPNKEKSGINNFTYILTPWSYRKDITDFKRIYPFTKLGVIRADGPWNDAATHKELSSILSEVGGQYHLIDYTSITDLENQLSTLEVDAVYLAEGFGVPAKEVQEIAQLLIDKKLPSFTSTTLQDVRNGWMATNQSNTTFERIFRRIALGVEAVVDGRNLSDRPVVLELPDTITLNFNTAEKINVPIRYSQIATMDLVGNFDEGVVDQSYTIIEAVHAAIDQNLNLKNNRINIELAKSNLDAAKTTYYPDLTISGASRYVDPDLARLSGGSNPERTLSGNATLSQTLYSEDGSAAISSQRNLLRAEEKNYSTTLLDTILSTTNASLNLLRQKNTLKSQAQNLEITRRNLVVAEQNYEAGQSGKADIFRFRSEMATNMQNVINAINTLEQAQHALNVILNNPLDTRVEIRSPKLGNDPLEPEGFGYQKLSQTLDDPAEQLVFQNFLIEQAFELSPELASLDYRLKAVERDIKQYGWRRYIPTVSAQAQYNRVYDRSGVGVPDSNLALDSDYNVGLFFEIPIFNRNSDNVNLRTAKQEKKQLLISIEQQRQSIESNIRDRILDVSGGISNIELSAVSEKAAQQSLELTEAAYANGAATVTDLIDSQNNYLQAQLASSNATYNFVDSALSMERAIGSFLFLDNDELTAIDIVQRYQEYRQRIQTEAQ